MVWSFQEDVAGLWWSNPWKFKGRFFATPFPWPVGTVPADNQLLLQQNQLAWAMVLKGFKENVFFTPRAPCGVIYCSPQQGIVLGNRCQMTLAVVSVSCSLLAPILSKTNHQVKPRSFVATTPVFHAQYIISPFAALQR